MFNPFKCKREKRSYRIQTLIARGEEKLDSKKPEVDTVVATEKTAVANARSFLEAAAIELGGKINLFPTKALVFGGNVTVEIPNSGKKPVQKVVAFALVEKAWPVASATAPQPEQAEPANKAADVPSGEKTE